MGTIPDAIDHGPVPLRPHPSSIIREDFTPSALSYFSGRGAPLQCRPLSLAGELMGLTYVRTNCFSPTKHEYRDKRYFKTQKTSVDEKCLETPLVKNHLKFKE
ncbi:hypothetical protein TNCT_676231 [Trichonephila clavata]|uniref:Uncharacterized protein n=1 Tax=Trichonephila clavata TaxID=2740835 RepID=A0A8X6ICR6_TRICU|nr:hypothetical protein TNCT_676231 [Trichonephila clavata]